jgi:hypothetical protein
MEGLRDFVANLLEKEGAAVEAIEPEGLEVLAPESVRGGLGWPELARLGFGATLPSGAIPIGLEGDWLDRFGTLLGTRGRFAERQITVADTVAPPGNPERLLEHSLQLENAIWRFEGEDAAWTRCLLLAFRYTAISDEKREGVVWVGFNQGTGAVLDGELLGRLRTLLADTVEWHSPSPEIRRAAGPSFDATTLAARVAPLVRFQVQRDLALFLAATRRRLRRDRDRIHTYHDDLRKAALAKLAALQTAGGDKAEADRKRETLRIAAVEREYGAKLDDLRHNYALRVTIDWAQGLTLFAPVHRYAVLIKRRKGERRIHLDWHPAIRMIEPPPSDYGPGVGRTRLVCDDRLHLTDPEGQANCPSCGKAWCRACHTAACPRCGHAI